MSDALQQVKAERSLLEFIRQSWHLVEPNNDFVPGWHISAICDHLQALTDGAIDKLIINIPPGHMKSLTCSVMWLPWWWIRDPSIRAIHASYAAELSQRDSRRTAAILTSTWYQERWPIKYTKLTEHRIETDAGGARIATSTGGIGTGERAHVVVSDDLLRAQDAQSDLMRQQAIDHILAMESRAIPGKPFRRVLIMQRLHEHDPTGYLLERELGYVHLCLPAEYEPGRKCVTSIGFSDPRTAPGEPLWPEAFGQDRLVAIKASMGEWLYSSQYQQMPMSPGGTVFKASQISVVDAIPADVTRWVRGWDLAATADGDYTVGVLMGAMRDGRYIIADVVRLRVGPDERDAAILATASRDGQRVRISLPQDPGQAGKTQAMYLTRLLAGYAVDVSPESGDKLTRAGPISAQINVGNVLMLRAAWNSALISEMQAFPHGKHDDQIDAMSRAFGVLLEGQRLTYNGYTSIGKRAWS